MKSRERNDQDRHFLYILDTEAIKFVRNLQDKENWCLG